MSSCGSDSQDLGRHRASCPRGEEATRIQMGGKAYLGLDHLDCLQPCAWQSRGLEDATKTGSAGRSLAMHFHPSV